MLRVPHNNPFMVSPIRSPGEVEDSTNSESKKSRNRHLVIINQLRRKEDAWDSRFHLQGIPEYRFGEDQHCETYKTMLVKKKSRKFVLKQGGKVQTPLDNNRRKMIEESNSEVNYKRPDSQDKPSADGRLRGIYPSEMKNKARAESLRRYTPLTEVQIKEKKAQQEKLNALWDKLKVPAFHRESFLKCENAHNMKQTIEIIKKEIEDLESNTSTIQLALRACQARENCLHQLRSLITKLEDQKSQPDTEAQNDEDSKQKASELLTHLRILSLNAVETILKWRDYIQQAYYITRGVVKANQTIMIPFLYQDHNYLIKMKNDSRDLVDSPLNKYFNFSAKSDPFLVYPSKEIEQHQDKLILYISKNLINRIRACELVILEESVHEHIQEKPTNSASNSIIKSNESPSERSLQKQEEAQQRAVKKTTIKIRNTNIVTSSKTNKNTSGNQLKVEHNAPKVISTSHPDSHSHLTETDEKKSEPQSANIKRENNEPKIKDSQVENEKQQKGESAKQNTHIEASPEREKTKNKEQTTEDDDSPTKELRKHDDTHPYVRPVDLYEDEIEEYMKPYLGGIDQAMKDSFISDPKVLIERANMGQDPMWFELIDPAQGGKRVGFTVAHIDNTVFTTRRLVIIHFTTDNREKYEEVLGKFVEYLWTYEECNEIKISLYYLEDQNNNLGADKQLQENIKKLGFRWKQLTHDTNLNKRYIVYILKRPEHIALKTKEAADEPIHVKSVVLLSDLQGDVKLNKNPKNLIDNRYAILLGVLQHCEEKLDDLQSTDTKRNQNYLQVVSSLVKEGQKKIGNLSGKFKNLTEMETFVGEKFEEKAQFIPNFDSKYAENTFTTSLLNLIYRWKSVNITHHSVGGGHKRYLKINNNNELVLLQSKHKNSSVYFIPTDDSEVNIFITDSDEIVNDVLQKQEIIEDAVSKLFSKLEKTPTPFAEHVWLPLFSIKEQNSQLDDAKALLKGDHKLNFASNTCTIGLNGTRVAGNLKVRPDDKCKIFEKPFLFGIVHEQVDFPLFAVAVQPQDFLAYDI